jgi:UTP:GlnB (protein PII) uridylyltransferase
MIQRRFQLTQEKPIYGTNIGVSIKSHWRNLPPLLQELKQNNASIHKAKYWNECTSMYIKAPNTYTYDVIKETVSTINETPQYESTLYSPGVPGRPKLPFNTTIFIYNIGTSPYTVLDFGCYDRTGLFCEILEVLSRYDIDIKGAYINTIGSVVSNIFFITHNEKQLSDSYIEYIKNNLDAEVLMQENDSY